MNPAVETGALIFVSIIVGLTLFLVPTPRPKPPEIDKPPVEIPAPPPPPAKPAAPQEIVAPIVEVPLQAMTPEQEEKQRLTAIESKLMQIQQQVQRMEKKVE